MKHKKLVGLFVLYLSVMLLFIIPEFTNNQVNAEIKTFKLEDSFEDTIQNKIYSQYVNSSVLETTNYYSLTLNAIADNYTNLSKSGGSNNYEMIDEEPHDSDTTYVYNNGINSWLYDTYELENNTVGNGVIDYVNVSITQRYVNFPSPTEDIRYYWQTHDNLYYTFDDLTFTYTTINHTLTTNSYTGSAWTWQEINDFDVGVGLKTSNPSGEPRATRVCAVVYYHNVTESIVTTTEIEQERTTYTAFTGLKSFIYNKSNTQYVSVNFTNELRNASIIIDLGYLEIFPQRIEYMIKSDVQTNLSLCFENATHTIKSLLDTQNNSSRFRQTKVTVNREDYLINESSYNSFYFEIDFNSSTPIYIDNLKITYTDLKTVFSPTIDTVTGTDLDDFDYEYSDTYLNFTGETNSDNEGIVFDIDSNEHFTRRMFLEYHIIMPKTSDNADISDINITQISSFNIDIDYEVVHWIELNPFENVTGFFVSWAYWCGVYKNNSLVIEDTRYNFHDTGRTYEIIERYDFTLTMSIYQETENSIISKTSIMNNDGGNTTAIDGIGFSINENLPQNSLTMANVRSIVSFRGGYGMFPTVDNTGYVHIFRSLTHSLESPLIEPQINFFNNLDWSNVGGAILNVLTFPIRFTIGLVKFCINVYKVLALIGNLLNLFKISFDGFSENWNLQLDESLLANLDNAFDFIDTDVENNLAGYSIFGKLGNVWDDYENNDWTGLNSSFPSIFTNVDYSILSQNEDLAFGFWKNILGFGLTDVWTPAIDIFSNIIAYITLFIIMFLMSIMFRLLKGDFESLVRDASRLFHAVQFIINAIIRIFEWIFEIISLILNVAIPFT